MRANAKAAFCPDRPGAAKGEWVKLDLRGEPEPQLWAFELAGGTTCTRLSNVDACIELFGGCPYVCSDGRTAILDSAALTGAPNPMHALVTEADGSQVPRPVLRLFKSPGNARAEPQADRPRE
jgi:hypothetical protein